MGFPPSGCRAPRVFPTKTLDIGPFGFFAGGRWQSHAWVRSGDWIVDITADQFDADPVVVTPACDPRYGAGACDTALPEFIAARRRAVDALWPLWLAWRAGC
ncbi:MAG TPA: hypothetical protein VNR51_02185 [Hyphomicrobium sp.]|nr:hypothetical protein [Hyphomicrobium sp.]